MVTSTRPTRDRRRRAEDVERERRYEQLVELSPDAILVHDGEHIVAANAAARLLAGASQSDELVGRDVGLVLNPPFLKAAQLKLVDESSPQEYTDPVRDTFRRLDGSIVQVEVRAVVFLLDGSPAAHVVIRDITDRLALEAYAREREERLHKAQRVEAVGALAGGVAHELNNMLAIILGHAAFVREDRHASTGARDDVRAITKAAQRAAAVTRQLLAFSRHAINRPEVVSLSQRVLATESALRGLLGSSRRLEFRLDAKAYARVDAEQFVQVLLTLAANARDATGTDGQVLISTGTIVVTEPTPAAAGPVIAPGRYSVLVVRDDGAGIDPQVQPRIFEPFFTTKPIGEGVGLGLAAVQGILEQSHGHITLTTEPGSGATFTVYLPEVDREALPESQIAAAPSDVVSADRRSVLVVDDEPALLAIATRLLQIAGLNVTTAANGEEALALIEQNGPPELVLTDIRMPGMGGMELSRLLKARWPNVSILLMSGYSAEYLRLEGTISADDEVVQKPYTAESLAAKVRSVLAFTPPGGTTSMESPR